jgi:hypothetical protein
VSTTLSGPCVHKVHSARRASQAAAFSELPTDGQTPVWGHNQGELTIAKEPVLHPCKSTLMCITVAANSCGYSKKSAGPVHAMMSSTWDEHLLGADLYPFLGMCQPPVATAQVSRVLMHIDMLVFSLQTAPL